MNRSKPLRLPLFCYSFCEILKTKVVDTHHIGLILQRIFFSAVTTPSHFNTIHKRIHKTNAAHGKETNRCWYKTQNTKWKQGYRLCFKQTVKEFFFALRDEHVSPVSVYLPVYSNNIRNAGNEIKSHARNFQLKNKLDAINKSHATFSSVPGRIFELDRMYWRVEIESTKIDSKNKWRRERKFFFCDPS